MSSVIGKLNGIISKTYRAIYKLPLYGSLLLLFFLVRIIPMIIIFLSSVMFDTPTNIADQNPVNLLLADQYPVISFTLNILSAGLLAPIVETLIFQTFLIWLINIKLRKRLLVAVIFSGLVFGMLHSFSIVYMTAGVFVGWLFALGYGIYNIKYNSKVAFWSIAGVHSLNNVMTILLTYPY